MARRIDLGPIDARTALDLAIMVEEDAVVRYLELARVIGDDPGGAGDVCRAMALREQEDRDRLAAQRAALSPAGPALIHVSAADLPSERPEVPDGGLPWTAAVALRGALAGERRAEAFYRALASRASDPVACALLEALCAEEAQHAELLRRKLAELDAARPATSLPCAEPAPREPEPPPRGRADPALLAAVLPRFDVATQAIARGILVHGWTPDAMAWDLGVTRRTVLRKLRRFLDAAPPTLVTDRGGPYAAAAAAGTYVES